MKLTDFSALDKWQAIIDRHVEDTADMPTLLVVPREEQRAIMRTTRPIAGNWTPNPHGPGIDSLFGIPVLDAELVDRLGPIHRESPTLTLVDASGWAGL